MCNNIYIYIYICILYIYIYMYIYIYVYIYIYIYIGIIKIDDMICNASDMPTERASRIPGRSGALAAKSEEPLRLCATEAIGVRVV